MCRDVRRINTYDVINRLSSRIASLQSRIDRLAEKLNKNYNLSVNIESLDLSDLGIKNVRRNIKNTMMKVPRTELGEELLEDLAGIEKELKELEESAFSMPEEELFDIEELESGDDGSVFVNRISNRIATHIGNIEQAELSKLTRGFSSREIERFNKIRSKLIGITALALEEVKDDLIKYGFAKIQGLKILGIEPVPGDKKVWHIKARYDGKDVNIFVLLENNGSLYIIIPDDIPKKICSMIAGDISRKLVYHFRNLFKEWIVNGQLRKEIPKIPVPKIRPLPKKEVLREERKQRERILIDMGGYCG